MTEAPNSTLTRNKNEPKTKCSAEAATNIGHFKK